MGSVSVDQLTPDGTVVLHPDVALSDSAKVAVITAALPGAAQGNIDGQRFVEWQGQALLYKQITHLGIPWDSYKKRIQIPKRWLIAYEQLASRGLRARFLGIYVFGDTTVFVDFDPVHYLERKANNSAAHVSTNDLFQALKHGVFERTDKNFNRITSLGADNLADYLLGHESREAVERFSVFSALNRRLFQPDFLYGLDAIKEMHKEGSPDKFQNEWVGFYLEHAFKRELDRGHYNVTMQRQKVSGQLDFDLAWLTPHKTIDFLGDLKASDYLQRDALGNDAQSLNAAIERFGKFWYVIYEHETRYGRDYGDLATIEWNEWRRANGHKQTKGGFNPLSYQSKFKESARFIGMKILEVNEANKDLVLGEFHQGVQQSGTPRAMKVRIKKKQMDNFLVFQERSTSDLSQ